MALALLLALYLVVGVFDHGIRPPTEPTVAGIVWNMAYDSELAVPKINGIPYLEKPPLYYWAALLMNAPFEKFYDPLIRLPAVLFGVASLFLLYWVARSKFSDSVAAIVALLGGTSYLFYLLSHRASTDMAAVFFSFLCFSLFAQNLHARGPTHKVLFWDLLFCLLLSVSFFAKNFYTYLIVVPPVFLFLLWTRQFRRVSIIVGALTFFSVLVISPWAYSIYKSGGWEYLRMAFIDNTLGRFFSFPLIDTSELGPLNDAYYVERGKTPGYYLGAFGYILLPWVFIALGAIGNLFKTWRTLNDFQKFLICSLVAIPAVLQLSSSKVTEYLVPVLFSVWLTVGDYLQRVFDEELSVSAWMKSLFSINISIVALINLIAPVWLLATTGDMVLILWVVVAVYIFVFWVWSARDHWLRDVYLNRFLAAVSVNSMLFAGALFPILDRDDSFRYFFSEIEDRIEGRALYTNILNDRRLPLINYYLDRKVKVVQDAQELQRLLAGSDPVAIIVSRDWYEATEWARSADSVQSVINEQGNKAFVYVEN